MKKSNLVTLLSLCFLVVAVILLMFFWKTPSSSSGTETDNNSVTQNDIILTSKDTLEDTNSTQTEGGYEASTSMQPNSDISMDDALFIGDSRTVGLMEYAGIDGADYFCTVGMSVYNIHKKPVSVPNVGKVTLTELLNSKKYGKIYIMLGINEVGYKFSNTIEKYRELIEFV